MELTEKSWSGGGRISYQQGSLIEGRLYEGKTELIHSFSKVLKKVHIISGMFYCSCADIFHKELK